MTTKENITIKNEHLELIYNMHSICEALIYDSLNSAAVLFCERVKKVSAISKGKIPEVEAMIMITSLNRCLYDFFQFYMHMSLTDCCYKNRVTAGFYLTDEDVKKAGIKVLSDYHKSFTLSREACGHLEKARIYIREHISEPLSLKMVGDAIHISSGYLSRIFSTLAAQTFCDYINEEKIAFGRKLLSQTCLSIDEIAERCGFNTPNYFATVFKKYMGQSPVAYRNSLLKEEQ